METGLVFSQHERAESACDTLTTKILVKRLFGQMGVHLDQPKFNNEGLATQSQLPVRITVRHCRA